VPVELTEQIVSLTEAAGLLPRRRKGRKPNVATLYRWAKNGCRGVVLETLQVGGTKCTSIEAIQRFCNRLSGGAAVPYRTTGSAERRLAQVNKELDAAGL
jgi:hypothetical protein